MTRTSQFVTVASTSPRHLRPVVAPRHDRAVLETPRVDHTAFLQEPPTTPGPAPSVRPWPIALAAGGASLLAVLALAALAPQVPGLPQQSTAVQLLALGTVQVAAVAVVVGLALRHWSVEARRVQAADHRALETAAEVARLRAAFLSNISHELRTPMTNILGFAQTIRAHHRVLPSDRLEDFADRLVANTTHLEQLVVDLLELHSDEASPTLRPETVHVEQLLRGVSAAAVDAPQQIVVRTTAGLVLVDRGKLERVVAELVGNVVRHTPPGTTAHLDAQVRQDRLLVSVQDDGPGMDPAIVAAAADPFVQGSRAQADPQPGLGIGLALVARHVEQLGGEFRVEQPRRGGTRVIVVVPVGTLD